MLERSLPFTSFVPPALLLLLVAAPGCATRRPDPAAIGAGLEAAFPGRSAAVIGVGPGFVRSAHGYRGAARRLAVELPAQGTDAIVFRPAGGAAVSVREIGVSGQAHAVDRAVAYARPGGASFWTTEPGGAEEWLRFEAGAVHDGEPAATWEIGGAKLTQRGQAVEVGTGSRRLRVTAPAAFAEGGAAVAARLRVRGDTIELLVDAGGQGVLVDPKWVTVSAMPGPADLTGAAVLADGTVLVVGGDDGFNGALDTAYGYDIKADTWTTEPSMSSQRELHTVTLLDNGKVLAAGGIFQTYGFNNDAEIFDPTTQAWTSNPMPYFHAGHTATTLKNNTVLLAGGWGPGSCGGQLTTNNVDLYDPSLGMDGGWGTSTTMNESRVFHAACTLGDGTVLVTGGTPDSYYNGQAVASAEIYDPAAQTWSETTSMHNAREDHTCATLSSGNVIVAGGDTSPDGIEVLSSVELYDYLAKTWTLIQPMSGPRTWHQMTAIPGGLFLVVGGDSDGNTTLPTTEIFDPVAMTWSAGPVLNEPREVFAIAALGNDVVVAGGWDSTKGGEGAVTDSAEVITFGLPLGATCTAGPACASGFCAAGLCCDTACTATCMACSAQLKGTGKDGTCGPVEAGTNPGNLCVDKGAAACGGDGACDGNGACGTYPDGTICHETTPCIVAVCSGGVCGGPNQLDGSPCPGGVCIAGACVPDPSGGSSSSSGSTGSSGSSSSGEATGGASVSTHPSGTGGEGGAEAGGAHLSGGGCATSPGAPRGSGVGLVMLGWLALALRRARKALRVGRAAAA